MDQLTTFANSKRKALLAGQEDDVMGGEQAWKDAQTTKGVIMVLGETNGYLGISYCNLLLFRLDLDRFYIKKEKTSIKR